MTHLDLNGRSPTGILTSWSWDSPELQQLQLGQLPKPASKCMPAPEKLSEHRLHSPPPLPLTLEIFHAKTGC